MMDSIDRAIINRLQGGFPICARPYGAVAQELGIAETELLQRLERMLERNQLSRFGPMFDALRMGGGLTLCAMAIPEKEFEQAAAKVNRHPEVAHNYAREHWLNMWFVLATETPQRITEVIGEIERETGHPVYNMPKREEFFVGLRFEL